MSVLIDKINMDNLTDMISKEGGYWIWCIQDGKHWITNRHFVLIFDNEAIEEDMDGWQLSACLGEKFENQKPVEGKQLVNQHGFISELLGKSGKTIADSTKEEILPKLSKNKGIVTPLIYAKTHFRNRWVKFPAFNLFIQDDYISLLYDATKEPVYSDAFNKPVFMCEGNFIILPVVEMEDKQVEKALKIFEGMPEVIAEVAG